MKKKKSTKMFVEYGNDFFKIMKSKARDSYFLDVLYYYVRRALYENDFNLKDVNIFNINGRFIGDDVRINLRYMYNNQINSIGLALSIRAIMLNYENIKAAYDNRLLFFGLDSSVISWNQHQLILDCYYDKEFSNIYDLLNTLKKGQKLNKKQIKSFIDRTIRPPYKYQKEYCRLLAADPSYEGPKIIKNNQFLYGEFETFDIPNKIEYIGNTAFAYCENLKSLIFNGKVIFGELPIIECNNLKDIIVPDDLIDYYKIQLPFYKDIIYGASSIDSDCQEEFSHIFDKKSSSYKFFWILSILQIYKNRKQLTIPYKNIMAKMVANAWNLVFNTDYNLGTNDQIRNLLNKVRLSLSLDENSDKTEIEECILEKYESHKIDKILQPILQHVPYRFLSPWIPYTNKADVKEKSGNPDYHCPYTLNDDYVFINSYWTEYFKKNYESLIETINNDLKEYLTKLSPNS